MKAINNPTKLWRIARNAVLLSLMALLSLNIVPVQAIPPGALAPGTTFENASALGLTGPHDPSSITRSTDLTTGLNGVRLETNSRDGYMFRRRWTF